MSDEWRAIPCRAVQWDIVPNISGRIAGDLYRRCSEPTDWFKQHRPEEVERRWHNISLGELADQGERQWLRNTNIGPVTIAAIKFLIDYAAAGHDVTRIKDAYVPQPIKKPDAGAGVVIAAPPKRWRKGR